MADTDSARDTSTDRTTTGPTRRETGPFLSKIGVLALIVVLLAGTGLLIGFSVNWMEWTPGADAAAGMEADLYDLDTPAFQDAFDTISPSTPFYLEDGATQSMLALLIAAILAFGLLSYEIFGVSKGPASLRSIIGGTAFVLLGTGAAALAGRFIGEAAAFENNFFLDVSSPAALWVVITSLAVAFLGLTLLYYAASHRTADRARYPASTQRNLTFVLVAVLGLAIVGFAAITMAPWTELRLGDTSPNFPGDAGGTFTVTGESLQLTENSLDSIPAKPFHEMHLDIQLIEGATIGALFAGLAGMFGLTYLRNRGDNEGAQVLMLVGAAALLAGIIVLFGHFHFVGHSNEVVDFFGQQAPGINVEGLTNLVPLIAGLLVLALGAAYAARVLPVAGQIVTERPAPGGQAFGGGAGGAGGGARGAGPGGAGGAGGEGATLVETDDGETVLLSGTPQGAQGAQPAQAAGATAQTLSPAETLAELDRRLIHGDIDEETYWDVRNRL